MTMKKNTIIFVLVLILVPLITISAVKIFYLSFQEEYDIPMDIQVGDKIGFNVDGDALHMGRTTPATQSSTRFIDITNDEDYKKRVRISFEGEMAPWSKVSEYDFILTPGETKELKFSVKPPMNTSFGNYTGNAHFLLTRKI